MAERDETAYQSQTEGARDSDFVKDTEDALRENIAANIKTLVRDIQYDAIKDRVKYIVALKKEAHDHVITAQAVLEKAQADEQQLAEQLNKLAAGDLSILDRRMQTRCAYCDTTYNEVRYPEFCPNCNRNKSGVLRVVTVRQLLAGECD